MREWLKKKFDGRVISRMMDQPWPAKSPDLSPLDYWFWGVAMSELRRVPPSTLSELKKPLPNHWILMKSRDAQSTYGSAQEHALKKMEASLKEA